MLDRVTNTPGYFLRSYYINGIVQRISPTFVAIALKMVKVPHLVQMKLTPYRLKIALGHFGNFKLLVKFQYGHFTQRHLTMEQRPQKKIVVPSKQKTDHTVERALKTDSK